jgi:acetyltransferase-like isoleucine patch superfamily enzyme
MSESRIPEFVSPDSRVSVGRFTYGSPNIKLWGEDEQVSIGAFCSIADGVTILGGGEHNTGWVTTFPLRIALGEEGAGRDGHPASKGPTRIGNDVWIGDGATILSGVTVGDVGARAVVAQEVLPYHVVVGNPAREVRARFTPQVVAALLRIRWWDWPLERIRAQVADLCGGNPADFIRRNDTGVPDAGNSETGED